MDLADMPVPAGEIFPDTGHASTASAANDLTRSQKAAIILRMIQSDGGRIMVWFPLVGLLIGAILASCHWALHRLTVPWLAADAVVLGVYALLTGALHLDGFADSLDGLFGGRDKPQRLTIMRDSSVGAFGVTGLVCLLLVKYGCLVSLPDPAGINFKTLTYLLLPVMGRWAQSFAAAACVYARRGAGTASTFVNTVRPPHAIAGLLFAAAFFIVPLLLPGAVVVCLGAVAATGTTIFVRSRIGGMTGDTLGFVSEIVETVCLLALAAIGASYG